MLSAKVSQQVKISIFDKIAMIFSKMEIRRKLFVSDNCDLFVCDHDDNEVFSLKFRHAGNVQYHKMTKPELKNLIFVADLALRELDN